MHKQKILEYAITALAFILIFGTHLKFDVSDSDIWLHLASGRVIYETKSIPKTDVLTFTAFGEPWSLHEWLYQIVNYVMYLKGGMSLLIFIKALTVCLAMGFLFLLIKKNLYAGIISTIIVSFVLTQFSNVRPHVVSWVFFLLTLLIIKRKREWILPIMILIWGNIHPMHLMGLVIIGLYLGERFLVRKDKKYVIITGLSIIAAMINPLGAGTFSLPFAAVSPYIREWQPFSIRGMYFYIYTAFVAIGAYSFYKAKKLRVPDAVLFLLLVYMGYTSRRHVAQAFVVLTPLIVNKFKVFDKEVFKKRDFKKDLVLIVSIVILIFTGIKTGNAFDTRFPWEMYPINETRIIKEYDIKGNVFNEYAYGSFLEFELYPHNLIYIDARAETMGEELMEEYHSLGAKRPQDIFKVVKKYNITIVIVEHVMGVGNYLLNSDEWEPIYIDGTRASFVLRNNETKDVPEFDDTNSPYVKTKTVRTG
ncbi:hypothetical protein KY361_00035 [Candidatus Woesearchaeota archaeon]|nr:hypothetical protein [Candidatus Woesearchaeota archaeon]